MPQKAEANAEAVAYVDGSYHAGTGEFACGAVIFYQGEAFEISQKFNDPDLAAMRNVAGEIKGSEAAIFLAVNSRDFTVPSKQPATAAISRVDIPL